MPAIATEPAVISGATEGSCTYAPRFCVECSSAIPAGTPCRVMIEYDMPKNPITSSRTVKVTFQRGASARSCGPGRYGP